MDFPPAVHTEFCQYLLSLCNLLDEWWGGLSHYTFKRLELHIAYSTLLAPRIGGRHWGCFLCHARARRQGSRTLDEKTGRNSPRAVSAGGLYVNYIMGLVMGGVVPFAQHTLAWSSALHILSNPASFNELATDISELAQIQQCQVGKIIYVWRSLPDCLLYALKLILPWAPDGLDEYPRFNAEKVRKQSAQCHGVRQESDTHTLKTYVLIDLIHTRVTYGVWECKYVYIYILTKYVHTMLHIRPMQK